MGHRIDISGQKFGRLTVIKFDHREIVNGHRNQYWLCKCDCGKEVVVCKSNLHNTKAGTKSCGCLQKESWNKRIFKHGLTHTPEFAAWQNAIERCINPTHQSFFRYGMRGITVCERWLNSFQNFIDDMGRRPSSKHELDRIDNNGNYEPSNCRWATKKEQAGNRRSNHWIEFDGKKMILSDWAVELGVTTHCIQSHLKRGNSEYETIKFYTNKKLMKCS